MPQREPEPRGQQEGLTSHHPAEDFGIEQAPEAEVSPLAELGNVLGADKNARIAIVEQLLFESTPGKPVFIDQELRTSGRGTLALITASSNASGEFEIWNGMPSKHGTFVVVDGNRVRLQSADILKPGSVFTIGASRIKIPADPLQATSALEEDIVALEVGESIAIGRRTYDHLSADVSRHHCTLMRVEDGIDKKGIPQKLFQLIDGVRGPQRLYLDSGDEKWDLFEGKITVGPGQRIRIGESGPVLEVPDPFKGFDYTMLVRGKVEEVTARSIVDSIADYASSRSIGGQRELNSLSFRAPQDLASVVGRQPQQAQFLGQHIKKGLELISQGSYEKAVRHFENAQVLRSCGFHLEPGNLFGQVVPVITAPIVYDLVQRVASRSWFKHDSGAVSPSYGILQKGERGDRFNLDRENVDFAVGDARSFAPRERPGLKMSPIEKDLLDNFKREICLIYAEEWTHAYQAALGGPVSRKGVLLQNLPRSLGGAIGGHTHEYDVNEFFIERKVPLSPMFQARYQRDNVHTLLKNYATGKEQSEIRSLLALAEVGSSITIGRNNNWLPESLSKQTTSFKIDRKSDGTLPDEQHKLRAQYIKEQIRPDHVKIMPLGAGRYSIVPTEPNATDGKVFTRDSYGIWRRLDSEKTALSGTRVRLGTSFEFKLP